uniref:Uncharacterized protein n=1 Tax=Siphoviridae sp. ctfza2 TaxID=2825599 RepID=A0A8S5UXS1_9CAUD|nr:MAG TPA: hypothetical protein [Siphoviridae sp. ctfza2]
MFFHCRIAGTQQIPEILTILHRRVNLPAKYVRNQLNHQILYQIYKRTRFLDFWKINI